MKSMANVSLDSAGIDNNTVVTIVAQQLVSLRCHHIKYERLDSKFEQQHHIKEIKFETGKRLGEPRPNLD